MRFSIHRSTVDEFYKELFKNAEKNRQQAALRDTFNLLLESRMYVLENALKNLSLFNVFNNDVSFHLDKVNGGGFSLSLESINIMGKPYPNLVLKGNNIFDLLDHFTENVYYLSAWIEVLDKSTQNVRIEDRAKYINNSLEKVYDQFPSPNSTSEQLQKETKVEITVDKTIEHVLSTVPLEAKDKIQAELGEKELKVELINYAYNNVSTQQLETQLKEKATEKVEEVANTTIKNDLDDMILENPDKAEELTFDIFAAFKSVNIETVKKEEVKEEVKEEKEPSKEKKYKLVKDVPHLTVKQFTEEEKQAFQNIIKDVPHYVVYKNMKRPQLVKPKEVENTKEIEISPVKSVSQVLNTTDIPKPKKFKVVRMDFATSRSLSKEEQEKVASMVNSTPKYNVKKDLDVKPKVIEQAQTLKNIENMSEQELKELMEEKELSR